MIYRNVFRAIPALLSLFLIAPIQARADKPAVSAKSKLSGHVDWSNHLIYATGLGAIPKDENNDAVAYLKARSFARMDARRNLLAVIDHVKIDSQTVGQDFQSVNDTVREEITGIIKGSEIFAERKLKIGNGMMVEVTITMPLYGEDSLGSVLYPEIAKRERQAEETGGAELPTPRLTKPHLFAPDEDGLPGASVPYTGVIIDARGRGVERSMSPKIRRTDGGEIWGTLSVAPDFVIENGITSYAHSVAEARKNGRVGSNPLVLRAQGRYGEKFKTDALLSEADADTLLAADAKDNFLSQFRVIFVVDEDK